MHRKICFLLIWLFDFCTPTFLHLAMYKGCKQNKILCLDENIFVYNQYSYSSNLILLPCDHKLWTSFLSIHNGKSLNKLTNAIYSFSPVLWLIFRVKHASERLQLLVHLITRCMTWHGFKQEKLVTGNFLPFLWAPNGSTIPSLILGNRSEPFPDAERVSINRSEQHQEMTTCTRELLPHWGDWGREPKLTATNQIPHELIMKSSLETQQWLLHFWCMGYSEKHPRVAITISTCTHLWWCWNPRNGISGARTGHPQCRRRDKAKWGKSCPPGACPQLFPAPPRDKGRKVGS